jgi:DNA-binding XRE family transcriptional regulator
MMFNERIIQLCEDRQIPQRKLAAVMDIGTASYCEIEKGCRARKEHISIIAELLQVEAIDNIISVERQFDCQNKELLLV